MTRWEFFKTYYQVTDRGFSDHLLWPADAREQARRKGQCCTSKTERKLYLAAQYLVLLDGAVCLWLGEYALAGVAGLWFLLSTWITDFSLVKIEVLYRVFRRDEFCAALLHQVFLGKTDGLWCAVKPFVSRRIAGLVRVNRRRLRVRYRVVLRKGGGDAFVSIRPNGITVRTKTQERTFDDPAMTAEDTAKQIAEVLNGI